ncbi:MAG: flavodoxin [Acidimicrobiales bacterium]
MNVPEAPPPGPEGPVRKTLLVVHHTVSPSTHAMLSACLEGARDPAIEGVAVVEVPALRASATDALNADGVVVVGPVNLGYLAGAIKHFFDQVYYPCVESTASLPYAAVLHADGDATGALRALESITAGLRWRRVAETVVVSGPPTAGQLDAVRDLGGVAAATLTV